MPVDWNKVETWERLVASMYASGSKPNLSELAKYFGTTYDTLENRLRKTKVMAEKMKVEVHNGQGADIKTTRTKSVPATPRKPKTPRKDPLDTVTNGRISKSTPSKKTATNIKEEEVTKDHSMDFGADMDDMDGDFEDGIAFASMFDGACDFFA